MLTPTLIRLCFTNAALICLTLTRVPVVLPTCLSPATYSRSHSSFTIPLSAELWIDTNVSSGISNANKVSAVWISVASCGLVKCLLNICCKVGPLNSPLVCPLVSKGCTHLPSTWKPLFAKGCFTAFSNPHKSSKLSKAAQLNLLLSCSGIPEKEQQNSLPLEICKEYL